MAQVDDALIGAGHPAAQHHRLDHQVRQFLQDHAVLEGARFALVRVADHVLGIALGAGGEVPFHSGGKTRPSHAAQAGGLESVHHFLAARFPIGRGQQFSQYPIARGLVRIGVGGPAVWRGGFIRRERSVPGGIGPDLRRRAGNRHLVDRAGRRAVATAQAGHLLHLHAGQIPQGFGHLGAVPGASLHGAGDVPANLHLGGLPGRGAKHGIEPAQPFEVVKRRPGFQRERPQHLVGHRPVLLLQRHHAGQ